MDCFFDLLNDLQFRGKGFCSECATQIGRLWDVGAGFFEEIKTVVFFGTLYQRYTTSIKISKRSEETSQIMKCGWKGPYRRKCLE